MDAMKRCIEERERMKEGEEERGRERRGKVKGERQRKEEGGDVWRNEEG